MDFKIAGTEDGITAIQMDIKIPGITEEMMHTAVMKARSARLKILEEMKKAISEPRKELSKNAPRYTYIQIRQEKIKDLIGPGGKNIRSIVEKTGVKIDIEDSGRVAIAAVNAEDAEKAVKLIQETIKEVEVGKIYNGKVRRIAEFGAFVEVFPGVDGLVHISQIDFNRIRNVGDVLKVGDEIPVKVIEIDKDGKIRLSRKEALRELQRKKEKK